MFSFNLAALGLHTSARVYLFSPQPQHVGSYFPKQGLNIHPLHWKVGS